MGREVDPREHHIEGRVFVGRPYHPVKLPDALQERQNAALARIEAIKAEACGTKEVSWPKPAPR